MLKIHEAGDNARMAYNSICGVLSQNVNGIASKVVLSFINKETEQFFVSANLHKCLDFPCCDVEVVSAETVTNIHTLNFKVAGAKYKGRVPELKKQVESGDLSGLDKEDYVVKDAFPDEKDMLYADGNKVRIEVYQDNDEEIEDYKRALACRKTIKEHLTESLGYSIVPAVLGGDETSPFLLKASVVLTNCKESTYQALKKYADNVFINTTINFRLATRKEIFNGLAGKHKAGEYEYLLKGD